MAHFTFQNLTATAETIPIPLAGIPMTLPESRVFRDALNLLGGTLAASRRQAEIPPGTDQRAQFEVVFGYAMLALTEGRALWSLLSCGLETPAAVHLRTMVEHAARNMRLIADAGEARRIYDSLGASERDLADDLTLDPNVRQALEQHFVPVVETKPDRKILPPMKKILETAGLGAVDYGDYRTMSQTVHGTVIALRKVAHVSNRMDRDFVDAAAHDGSTPVQFIRGTYLALSVISALAYISGAEINDEFLRISEANVALARAKAGKR